jgi:hypothetical protein
VAVRFCRTSFGFPFAFPGESARIVGFPLALPHGADLKAKACSAHPSLPQNARPPAHFIAAKSADKNDKESLSSLTIKIDDKNGIRFRYSLFKLTNNGNIVKFSDPIVIYRQFEWGERDGMVCWDSIGTAAIEYSELLMT